MRKGNGKVKNNKKEPLNYNFFSSHSLPIGKLRISFIFLIASDTSLSGHLVSSEVKEVLQLATFNW